MIRLSQPVLGEGELAAVSRVLQSGNITQGPEVAAFEDEFARALVDGRESVAVNSGTSALHLALLALGVGPGDEVIVPSFTFAATANSVSMTGATPVFVDVDASDYCMDPSAVEAALTTRTVAVLPVHLYGHPARVDVLAEICASHGLLLVEDCAQAHGSSFAGIPVGAWGDAAAFSFYPSKNMTTGEGGMVVLRDPDIARRVRLLRNQGQERRYENEIIGLNNRMSDLHAAIGRVQLQHLPEWTAKRQRNAALMSSLLQGVQVPVIRDGVNHVFHQYTVRVPQSRRDAIRNRMAEMGIETGVYYPNPVHTLPAFAGDFDLPVTARLARECLSLPIHPSLSNADLEEAAKALNDIIMEA